MNLSYSSFLHNVVFPGSLALTRSHCYPLYREMLKLEYQPREEVQSLQWRRFRKLLMHAYDNVPFYRKRLDESGVRVEDIRSLDDVARLPILTKRQVQRNFPDRITASNTSSVDWRYVSTRGTSDRLILIQDFEKRDMVRAAELRCADLAGDYRVGKVWAEIPPDVCSVVCGDENEPDEGVFPYAWKVLRSRTFSEEHIMSNLRGLIERRWLYRRITYPPFGAEGTNIDKEHLDEYIERLWRDRPFLLKALPTYLYKIAQYVAKKKLEPLPVTSVKPMGGSVSSVMREQIKRGFAGQYSEDYGSSEFGGIACSCRENAGLHVFLDAFLVEVVADDRHCRDGELGKVLVTDLSNYAMPMIRYQIGDLARIDSSFCACGRTAPRITVEGRLEDSIRRADGSMVSNDTFMDFFYSRPDVDQFQLVEVANGNLELKIVPSPEQDVDVDSLRQDFRLLMCDEVSVRIQKVRSIAPEASGKFRFVKAFQTTRETQYA